MSSDFTHVRLGQRVIFRTGGAADGIGEEVERRGASRVLGIAGASTRSVAHRLLANVPIAAWVDVVVQHVPIQSAERARTLALENGIDLIVCVGGGSTTGLAKAVALTTGLPIVAVPTTYAGSEATSVWGLTQDRTKQTGTDDRVLPETVVYDATLTTSLPKELSITSGLNALAHCVDSLWAPRTDPISQALALEGARALAQALPQVVADGEDLPGREAALYGCYLAASAFASAGSGLHHKICHVLGGTFNLPHAATHAIVLPYVLALNAPAVPELAGRLATALGGSGSATEALEVLRVSIGAPRRLADIGLTEADIPEAVARSVAAAPADNPVAVTEDELTDLLTRALRGESPQHGIPALGVDAEQSAREESIVREVVASFDRTPSPRLKALMQALVRHSHAYLREVRLTQDEWEQAVEFLTAAGHITDERRQEFILLSDVLGLSMQTIAVSNQAYADATESTVFGPFFVDDAPQIGQGGDIAGGASGTPCWVEGSVRGTGGEPISGARIEVWQADDEGFYDVQRDDGRVYGRAYLFSDETGGFCFWGLQPTPYPIPHDGPVGRMLEAVRRSPYRAAHLHFMVTAPGYRTLVTHIFVAGDPQLDVGDSVFGVKRSLIKQFDRQPPGTATPDGRDVGDHEWSRTAFDIVLAPEGV